MSREGRKVYRPSPYDRPVWVGEDSKMRPSTEWGRVQKEQQESRRRYRVRQAPAPAHAHAINAQGIIAVNLC